MNFTIFPCESLFSTRLIIMSMFGGKCPRERSIPRQLAAVPARGCWDITGTETPDMSYRSQPIFPIWNTVINVFHIMQLIRFLHALPQGDLPNCFFFGDRFFMIGPFSSTMIGLHSRDEWRILGQSGNGSDDKREKDRAVG